MKQEFLDAADSLMSLAAVMSSKGWLPATSGNLSVRVAGEPVSFAVTASGVDKTRLQIDDILCVTVPTEGMSELRIETPRAMLKPSAETGVHVRLYQKLSIGAILHAHTVANNVVSEVCHEAGAVEVSGHEMLKALGHWEENASMRVPIVENHHDLAQLEQAVADAARHDAPGVLVRRHGIYAFGDTANAALRHLEAFEFLFQYHVTLHPITHGCSPTRRNGGSA